MINVFCKIWHYVCRNGSTNKSIAMYTVCFILFCKIHQTYPVRAGVNIPTSDQAQQSDQIAQMCLLFSCLSLFLFTYLARGNIGRWDLSLLCATGWLRKQWVGLRVGPVGGISMLTADVYWILAQEILNKCKANCFWHNYSRPFCQKAKTIIHQY